MERNRLIVRRELSLAVAVVLVSAALTGCVGVRGGELEDSRPWPPATSPAEKKPAVVLSLVGKALYKSKPLAVDARISQAWLDHTRESYLSSGLFSEIHVGKGEASDLRADVEVLEIGSGSKFL